MYKYVIILFLFTFLLFMRYRTSVCYIGNDILYVEPMWGIGNRLRVIRKAYALCKHLNRRLVIVDEKDHGFDHESMKELFEIHDICFISREHFEDIKRKQNDMFHIQNLDKRCETKIELKDLTNINTALYSKSCDIYNQSLDEDNTFYKDVKSVFNNKAYHNVSIHDHFKKNNGTKVVGVHIRQGSVADYVFGNFFGKWENSNKAMSPYFPQFKKKDMNLSTTHPKAKPLEEYIDAMRKYDPSVMFFICADRIGTLIYLYQIFREESC